MTLTPHQLPSASPARSVPIRAYPRVGGSELVAVDAVRHSAIAASKPTPFSSILYVLTTSPDRQVARANAPTVVAAMQSLQANRYWAKVDLIRDSMSVEFSIAPAVDHTVACTVDSCDPAPTVTALLNLRPEPLSKSFHSNRESN